MRSESTTPHQQFTVESSEHQKQETNCVKIQRVHERLESISHRLGSVRVYDEDGASGLAQSLLHPCQLRRCSILYFKVVLTEWVAKR